MVGEFFGGMSPAEINNLGGMTLQQPLRTIYGVEFNDNYNEYVEPDCWEWLETIQYTENFEFPYRVC